ncbi:MAG: hypothetical protein OXG13_12700 [Gemmatimonadaceae bacterium]|nr:hypothetical protein [Gemmatimonadaceae bacterium]
MTPASVARALGRGAGRLRFSAPVAHVYNPLVYASEAHHAYLERYCRPGAEILLVGMNPGPWGMVQTGVPFGEVGLVRDWLGIDGGVRTPRSQHPRRPVEGFACRRSEVSGRRLWGWARDRFGTPDRFFERFFVWNYCPLAFLEESGRNRTPDKLPAAERAPLFEICDRALVRIADHLSPRWVLGVGRFGRDRARAALDGGGSDIGEILHPSPASPAANRGWAGQVEDQLAALGIDLESGKG